MRCPHCGKEIWSGAKYCPYCKKKLSQGSGGGHNNNDIWKIVIAVAAIAAAAVAVFFVLKGTVLNKKDRSASSESTETEIRGAAAAESGLEGAETDSAVAFATQAVTESSGEVTADADTKEAESLETTESPAIQDVYQVSAVQYDLHDFPDIKVYLKVTDENGEFVSGLPEDAFYVNEGRTLTGDLTRQQISKVTQLDEEEPISISLVADVSGSMSDSLPIAQAQMTKFLDSVQFSLGDEVELTQFNDLSNISCYFTDDKQALTDAVSELYADGQTRLYDTLIVELGNTQRQNGAKCIIGFTDGLDNVSSYTAQDVIDLAKDRNIPIFLVGIGSEVDEETLRQISEETGGRYFSLAELDSLGAIYDEIYRDVKQLYLLDIPLQDDDNLEDDCAMDISIATADGLGGNAERLTIPAQELLAASTEPMDNSHLEKVVADSLSAEDNYGISMDASNLIDGTTYHAWADGSDGNGTGETIQYIYDGDYTMSGFTICSGYQKDNGKDLYRKNSRPSSLEVLVDGESVGTFDIEDRIGEQTFVLPQMKVGSEVTFVIRSVYEGYKYPGDCVISELTVY